MRDVVISVVTAALFASGPGGAPGGVSHAEPGSTPVPAASTPSSGPMLHEVKVHLCDTYTFRPVRILVACGDGNVRMVHLRWPEWTAARALGVGTWRQNDCKPDCADGTFRDYPVRLALAEPMGTGPKRFFGRVVADFPRNAPPAPAYRSGHAVLMNNGRDAGPLLRCPEKRSKPHAIAHG
jgi:hypothetical protein